MMVKSTMIFHILFSQLLQTATSKQANVTSINQWPMIMAHDAATTYLEDGGIINPWAKTQQSGGTTGMLNCGARAFDWRPSLQTDGSLIMHHSSILVKHNMSGAVDEIVEWVGLNHNGARDLVILGITDCDGGSACNTAVEKLLGTHNITIVTVADLASMTAQDAVERGRLANGGALLACESCWQENYESYVTCSGFGSGSGNVDSGDDLTLESSSTTLTKSNTNANVNANANAVESLTYSCYTDSSNKAIPLDRMWQYLNNISKAGPPEDGRLYTAQALWQESSAAVAIGTLHGSNLLKDESKSSLNALLAQRITAGQWNVSNINMVEINNVCDGGNNLKKVLDSIP